jgi:hypothetical protein
MRARTSPPAPLLGEERGERASRSVDPVVASTTYDIASRLAFYVPGQPRVYCFFINTRDNQYRYLNEAAGLRLRDDALIVDNRPPDDPLLPPFEGEFDRVEHVPIPVVVYVRGIFDEPVVTYHLYRCYGYRNGVFADPAPPRSAFTPAP